MGEIIKEGTVSKHGVYPPKTLQRPTTPPSPQSPQGQNRQGSTQVNNSGQSKQEK